MKATLFAAAAAAAFSLSATGAFAGGHGDCVNMLTASVGMELEAEGFDTTNVCDLTVSDLAVIKGLLETDGMNSSTRGRIEKILSGE